MKETINIENEKIQIVVQSDFKRLDKFINFSYPEYSRSKVKNWIENGYVKVNDRQVNKSGEKLSTGDIVEIEIPEEKSLDAEPEKMDLDIIYEDDDVLVVNKPQGIVVHPSVGHPNHTLVNGVLYHTKIEDDQSTIRPGIVHRIDKDTSGLLMIAKNDQARESLMKQLKDKTNKREYLALAHGTFEEKKGMINAPIGRSKKDRKQQAVVEDGKNSVTHFTVLKQFKDYALLSLNLETGRTHQIRVHLKYIGHPIAGDPMYGPKKTLHGNGQFLHAYKLGFNHPKTGDYLEFKADPPKIFLDTLEELQTDSK